ncbi:MAG: Hint domain-containing protein [Burkholderiales bacterium]|nr:Hint domain-containing protein [Burkholderiales bacterium]
MADFNGNSEDNVFNGTPTSDLIKGRGGNDMLLGEGGDDEISGGSGDDSLFGGEGDDELKGGSGTDFLSGGEGDDELAGGSGDDTLEGGEGDDELNGGSGADLFLYNDDGVGNDTIENFKTEEDIIDLVGLTGVDDPSDVQIDYVDGNAIITWGDDEGNSITVENVKEGSLEFGKNVYACFQRGTLISTPDGSVAVEDLAIGDLVVNLDGVARPVKWVGRRSFQRRFVGANSEASPVLIRAGALGHNGPDRDLTLSAKHAMFFDGVFVRAEDLVNGDTIIRDRELQLIEYFHVELDSHDVIFANGSPTETYSNHNSRRMFANWQEYVDLYGSEDALQPDANGEFPRTWPLVEKGPDFERVMSLVGKGYAVAA